MANVKSAKKRVRISEVKRARNVSTKSSIKTSIRKYEEAIAQGNTDTAADLFNKVSSQLDKAAAKGIIHKNTAARKKSRLAARI